MIEHAGFVLWFTGLPGAGKTTLAKYVEQVLRTRAIRLERLDGDTVRESLTKDLGFSKSDRDTNIERVTFVAKLLSRNNVVVLAAFISPYHKTRHYVREQVTNYIEIFVDAPLDVCARRDVKGMYARAFAGEIENFTGVNDPYEIPENPDIHVYTHLESVEESGAKILIWLEQRGLIPAQITL